MSSIKHNFSKMPVVMLSAAGITVCLFFVMQRLVQNDLDSVMRGEPVHLQPISFSVGELIVHTTPPKPSRPPERVVSPQLEPEGGGIGDNVPPVRNSGPLTPVVLRLPGINSGGSFTVVNGAALPLKQVNPIYPSRALSQGVEGFVELEFDISPDGNVINARVLYAEPEGIFDRAALRAISRWSFKPKVENGNNVAQYNERRRISFSLED